SPADADDALHHISVIAPCSDEPGSGDFFHGVSVFAAQLFPEFFRRNLFTVQQINGGLFLLLYGTVDVEHLVIFTIRFMIRNYGSALFTGHCIAGTAGYCHQKYKKENGFHKNVIDHPFLIQIYKKTRPKACSFWYEAE